MAPTYDFSQTRNQIILRALRLCGVVAQGDDPTPEQVSEAAQALESLVKWLQADGTQLWSIETRTMSVVSGDDTYTLGTDVLVINVATLTDSAGDLTRLSMVPDDIFMSQKNPTMTGRPEIMNVRLSATTPSFQLYPVPDGTYTLTYKVIRKLADFDTALGTPDMPQRWFDPLCYSLAANLADEYQLPMDIRNFLTAKAKNMRDIAGRLDQDPQDVFFMNPI